MSHRHVNKRTGLIVGASGTALLAAVILLPDANASPDAKPSARTFTARSATQVAGTLVPELGPRAAGWYYDGDRGRLVVNVLDEAAARRVRESGAEARAVENSTAELRAATRTLSDSAALPGTAWSIDPRTNKVRVIADRTVTGSRLRTLTRTVERMGGLVSVQRSRGEFTAFDTDGAVNGGDAIFGGGSRCSLGFNVTVGGAPAFLTAGHCGNIAPSWTSDQGGAQPLGTTRESQFPGSDFALVTYDDPNAAAPSSVDLQDGGTQEITRVADAAVGMEVQRAGSTTGRSAGTVTGLDATVNYGNGDIVNGLIQTDVCAEPGDSGGAMFSGDAAVGLTSGGSGDCTQGGETFFQPVSAALEATGAVIGGEGGAASAPGAAVN
ncbi:S1 family peptidase [Streptomyces sp. XD-27]|uniref:S1 family peptidase n=1 Tax=Streptomyces sp. XD-27 TaxID=3062779 RepID=UPI0026F46A13|nr:S1 family peptidase [Streptomyces sp. XD-27]WKX69150.1 S1 family peptidase [Streptomyces sp. XD-27]